MHVSFLENVESFTEAQQEPSPVAALRMLGRALPEAIGWGKVNEVSEIAGDGTCTADVGLLAFGGFATRRGKPPSAKEGSQLPALTGGGTGTADVGGKASGGSSCPQRRARCPLRRLPCRLWV